MTPRLRDEIPALIRPGRRHLARSWTRADAPGDPGRDASPALRSLGRSHALGAGLRARPADWRPAIRAVLLGRRDPRRRRRGDAAGALSVRRDLAELRARSGRGGA